MSFHSLNLSEPLLRALKDKGYQDPTPIQIKATPAILEGKDVLASAQTGTGKTAGFVLPILEKLIGQHTPPSKHTHVLVITPTRELASQINENIEAYSKYMKIKSVVVFGGVSIKPQISKLRQGVDIVVATPGRLLDLVNQGAIVLSKLKILVLDEADRMLDMGFIKDIQKIVSRLPTQRQNLLFSATYNQEIRKLTISILHKPVKISVAAPNSTADKVVQCYYKISKNQKAELLKHLFKQKQWYQALVFARTKHGADSLTKHLKKSGILAAAIHGNKSQGTRTRALDDFKKNKLEILVATDIAARGLDIQQLPLVVNYDLPQVPEDYVHRIGRTGRAGEVGHAMTFVTPNEFKEFNAIQKILKQRIQEEVAKDFSPSKEQAQVPKKHQDNPYHATKKFSKKKGSTSSRNNNTGFNRSKKKKSNSNRRQNKK